MNWIKKLIGCAKAAYSSYRALPADDRKRIEDNAKKLSKRVLKK